MARCSLCLTPRSAFGSDLCSSCERREQQKIAQRQQFEDAQNEAARDDAEKGAA